MDRKLIVSFGPGMDVEYLFSRDDRPLTSYVVEHPEHLVDVLRSTDAGYSRKVTTEGCLELIWPKRESAPTRSSVGYIKREKLELISGAVSNRYRFRERIKIRAHPCFGLWLGGEGRLSAVQALSSATFHGHSGNTEQFKPRQLLEHVFHESGLLLVDWTLERLGHEAAPTAGGAPSE